MMIKSPRSQKHSTFALGSGGSAFLATLRCDRRQLLWRSRVIGASGIKYTRWPQAARCVLNKQGLV